MRLCVAAQTSSEQSDTADDTDSGFNSLVFGFSHQNSLLGCTTEHLFEESTVAAVESGKERERRDARAAAEQCARNICRSFGTRMLQRCRTST